MAVQTWEIKDTVTPVVTLIYGIVSAVHLDILTVSFTDFQYSLSQTLFTVGGLDVTLAALASMVLPASVYVINDNNYDEITTQTGVAAIPVGTAALLWLSPPLSSAVSGSVLVKWLLFVAAAVATGLVAGPQDYFD